MLLASIYSLCLTQTISFYLSDYYTIEHIHNVQRLPSCLNPDQFIPERWLRNEVRDFSPFASLPFGFGTRSCVGRRIAESMIYLTVANVSGLSSLSSKYL